MKRLLSVSLLVILQLSCAAFAETERQDADRIGAELAAEAQKGGYRLVAPEELRSESLSGEAVLFVDVRQDWSYQMQHIKGAVQLDFAPTWWNQYSPSMRSEMRRVLGPDLDKRVVFY